LSRAALAARALSFLLSFLRFLFLSLSLLLVEEIDSTSEAM